MLKSILSAIILLASTAAFADPVIVQPGQPTAVAVAHCQAGCIVLDPTDLQTLQESVRALAQEAFEAGVKAGVAKEKSST